MLSSIDYSFNQYAKLEPFTEGLLNFACGTERNLFDYHSRLAATPNYSSIYQSIKKLGEREAIKIKNIGKDPTRSMLLRIDNVQSYAKQYDMRMGRENAMKVGIAATAVEAAEYSPGIFDLDETRERIARGERESLTVEKLYGLIDHENLVTVGALQWLRALVNYVPQLSHLKAAVQELYKVDGKKHRIPGDRKTVIHPLGTSSKNETIVTELKEALIDFLDQIGQTESEHNRRVVLIGGDGMTFEKILQMKRYMGFHGTEWQRFNIIQPFLELWHTEWTDLSRIFETHWGYLLTKDPSTLGHSATQINRKPPSNLKKVDYYPGAHLVYLVLDARMLDCWR